jgi:hypothetical protein
MKCDRRPARLWALAGSFAAMSVACGGGGGGDTASSPTALSGAPSPSAPSPAPGGPSPAPATGGSGAIPTPLSIAGKPQVGQIRARSGQVIENVHVSNPNGSCIVIDGVSDVTIRDSEIGPCGSDGDPDAQGIDIHGAGNIRILRNVIHDVSTGVYAVASSHPIVMDRNYVYNVRGPLPRGQMIQLNGVAGGASGSKVTCNVSDAMPGVRYAALHGDTSAGIEDHVNLFSSPGLEGDRTEIAYNRLRGGSKVSTSGSGIMIGDGDGGHVNAHHNTIVDVVNAGAGIAGGVNVSFDDNRIYLSRNSGVYINVGMYVWGQAGASCAGHTMTNNRVWTLNSLGAQNPFWDGGNCGAVDLSGNVLGDTSLSPSIFDEVPSACR